MNYAGLLIFQGKLNWFLCILTAGAVYQPEPAFYFPWESIRSEMGGEALDEGLRALFHRIGPSSLSYPFPSTFPSEQTLISLTVCGFAAYLLVRH